MIFDVMKANDKNDHDAADIVCNECKSVIATLHGAERPPGWRAHQGRPAGRENAGTPAHMHGDCNVKRNIISVFK